MSISTASNATSTLKRYRYVATGGETSVSGVDANGNIISYTQGIEQVFLNGTLLVRNTDYTASDGTSITGLTALVASDVVEVLTFAAFTVATALGAAQDDAPLNPVEGQIWLDTNGSMADGGNIAIETIDAKGDLIVGTSNNAVARVAVGADGQFLTASSTSTAGVSWTTVSTIPFASSSTTSNITLVAWNNYFVDTSSARTLTLPASPSLGDEIHIFDATGSAATNNITVNNNSLNIAGSAQTLLIDTNYAAVVLVYTGSTYGWRVS